MGDTKPKESNEPALEEITSVEFDLSFQQAVTEARQELDMLFAKYIAIKRYEQSGEYTIHYFKDRNGDISYQAEKRDPIGF